MTAARRATGDDLFRRAFPIVGPDPDDPSWGNWRRVAARRCAACVRDGNPEPWDITIIWEYTGPLEHRRLIAKPDVVWPQCVQHYTAAHLDPFLEGIRGL